MISFLFIPKTVTNKIIFFILLRINSLKTRYFKDESFLHYIRYLTFISDPLIELIVW